MSEFVILRGKAKYARTITPDQFGKWKILLYPDADSLDKVFDLQNRGIKNSIKKDAEGFNINISRPERKESAKGKVTTYKPPVVKDEAGNDLANVLIGDGSDVSVEIEVYSYPTPTGGRGTACRLNGIKVHTLVPYPNGGSAPAGDEVKSAERLF